MSEPAIEKAHDELIEAIRRALGYSPGADLPADVQQASAALTKAIDETVEEIEDYWMEVG